jgi:hypothetical protein
VSPGSRDSISRPNGRPAGPNCLDPRTIRSFDLLKGVTLYSRAMIDISVGIGETKKGHSLDGPHWPRLRGNRQHYHGQAHTRRTKLPEDHFECPLLLQAMIPLCRMSCGPEQAGLTCSAISAGSPKSFFCNLWYFCIVFDARDLRIIKRKHLRALGFDFCRDVRR